MRAHRAMSAGREGDASLAIGALAEGTTRLDGATLTEKFESLGTGLSSSGDWDDATAHIAVTPERLETAMGLLGEVIDDAGVRAKGCRAAQSRAARRSDAAAG